MGCGLAVLNTKRGSFGNGVLEAIGVLENMIGRLCSPRISKLLKELHLLDRLENIPSEKIEQKNLRNLRESPGLIEKLRVRKCRELNRVFLEESGNLPSSEIWEGYKSAMKTLELARDHPGINPIYKDARRLYQAVIGVRRSY